MYRIDRSGNRLERLSPTRLSEVDFREREHLQEWIAADPKALGDTLDEELLIIQKEFDGFDETRERLDLLALDKQGRLVIIENKLDDSGRDVVWQALKYAAYCSSMQKAEVVSAFQSYLDRYEGGGSAQALLCEFLEEESLDDVILNDGTGQRVLFVATHFRKEVTATVLWLREYGIDARCIKVKPYSFGEDVFVDLQQVIPPPEAADYMIRMAKKEKSQPASCQDYQRRMEYWGAFLDKIPQFDDLSPPARAPNQGWLKLAFSPEYRVRSGGGIYAYRILNEKRIGVYLSVGAQKGKDFARWQETTKRFFADAQPHSCWDVNRNGHWQYYITTTADAMNEADWPSQHDWMQEQISYLLRVWKSGLFAATEELNRADP